MSVENVVLIKNNKERIFLSFVCFSHITTNFVVFMFVVFSGGSNRLEEATECYHRAANNFKMAKNWQMAGKAFGLAGDLHGKAGNRHDAATNYVDASNSYKKVDVQEAVNCLLKAIEIYTDMGRFSMAAKHHQTIAEMYENEANDLVCAGYHLKYSNFERKIMNSFNSFSNALSNTMSKLPTISRAKNRPVRQISAC